MLCPSPGHVKYYVLIIVIGLLIMIQYPDIVAGKHAETTRHYKFNVSSKLLYILVHHVDGLIIIMNVASLKELMA